MSPRALLVAAFAALPVLAGCLSESGDDGPGAGPAGGNAALVPVSERLNLPYNVTGHWSHTLVEGVYEILDGVGHFVQVELPPTELGAATFDLEGPRVHLGLFMPDIPGCDYAADTVAEKCKVPVIADAGPYYKNTGGLNDQELDTIATEPAGRLGRFLIENFVPHGYAVAQVSVFGTGDSNHCMDLFGAAEQAGVDAAVTWLGSQPWSLGSVALIGRSYDGSTPWMGAAFGNPYLKTIVPISGLTGLLSQVQHNGSFEWRIAAFHNLPVSYGAYGLDGEAEDIQNLCPDYLTAAPWAAAAILTGNEVVAMDPAYWHERQYFPRVLQNYEGSVYFIHGLQDWNVDPHHVSPAYRQLQAKGLDVKGLFGQWAHNYPDRVGEHVECDGHDYCRAPDSVRTDWAQDLLEWFDHYLKGTGPKPDLHAEVQDNAGRWRFEPTYPPRETEPLSLGLSGEPQVVAAGQSATVYSLGVLSQTQDTLLSGHAYLDATVIPTGAAGQIFFQLDDANGTRLTFGIMDIRYRNGEMEPVVPGVPTPVRVQSMPFEALVPAGHEVHLLVANAGADYLADYPPSPTGPTLVFEPGASTLGLPVRNASADSFFTPPPYLGDLRGPGAQA